MKCSIALIVLSIVGCGKDAPPPPCHGVDVMDKATRERVLATAEEAQNGILQGRYVVEADRMRVRQAGKYGTVDTEDLMTALGQGASLVDPVLSEATPKCKVTDKLRSRPPGQCTWCANH